jgi:hypothetical protein
MERPCCGVLLPAGEERVNCLRSVEHRSQSVYDSVSHGLHRSARVILTKVIDVEHRKVGTCFDSQSIYFAVSGGLYSWKVGRLRIQDTTPCQGPFRDGCIQLYDLDAALPTWLAGREFISIEDVKLHAERSLVLARTWKSSFSSHKGLSECRMTHI